MLEERPGKKCVYISQLQVIGDLGLQGPNEYPVMKKCTSLDVLILLSYCGDLVKFSYLFFSVLNYCCMITEIKTDENNKSVRFNSDFFFVNTHTRGFMVSLLANRTSSFIKTVTGTADYNISLTVRITLVQMKCVINNEVILL